jgi:outer membrane protein
MKSIKIVLIALFSLFYVSLNAQLFIGGSFGLHGSGGNTDDGTTTTDKTSSFGFSISPRVGKFLTEKVAVGLEVDFNYNHSKTPGVNEVISNSSTIGFSPFLRYYVISFNKFSVFGQGNVGLSFSGSSTKTNGTSNDGPKITRISLNIAPGLAYDLSDKLSLETSLHFLGLGFDESISKQGTSTDRNSNFNFNAGLDNISQLGAITIGAIYKF